MIDQSTLQQLFATYAWGMDGKEFHLLNEVFTEDATFAGTIAGGGSFGPFEGRSAIVDFITEVTKGQGDQRRHVITNTLLRGETSALANLTLIVIADGQLTVQATGVYSVELAQEGGAWRFKTMSLALDLMF
jgi:hypothetical protein